LLVPEYIDQQSGNAAPCYYRAVLALPRDREQQYGTTQQDWLELPLDEFPRDLATKWLKPYASTLEEAKKGAYRERCEWDFQVRQLPASELLSLRLTEVQQMREIARVLRVKSRLEIAEGRFDDAQETLITGYQMAHHMSGSPIMLNELVAIAVASTMNASVVDWISAGGPNLYWGLASLPTPLVDVRKAIHQEMSIPLRMFPFLRNPESLNYTPEQWRHVIGESFQKLSVNSDPASQPSSVLAQTAATGMILAGYTAAKEELIKSGMDAAKVEAMPVGQVVAIQTARGYHEAFNESTKWTYLPYWQSYRQLRQSIRNLHQRSVVGTPGAIPVWQMLLPATESVVLAPVRMEREIAALQTIEAIRMFAADAKGRLPASLANLQQSPAPLDPITGTVIKYHVANEMAILELPPPEGRNASIFGKRFEVTLKPAQ
jgi:hypothetical protein